jgi:hypothetical protein
MYAGWNWQWYAYVPGVVKVIGSEDERPEMSPVSKLTGSPGFEVIVWSAVSWFFNTIVLLTPITRTRSCGEKLISLIPDPAGAMIITVFPAAAGVEGCVAPPTEEIGVNRGCSPGITSIEVMEMAIRRPAIASMASAGLFGSIASCSLMLVHH